MPDHVHMLVSIPPKYSVAEDARVSGRTEKLNLDCSERRAQGAQFYGAQVLGHEAIT